MPLLLAYSRLLSSSLQSPSIFCNLPLSFPFLSTLCYLFVVFLKICRSTKDLKTCGYHLLSSNRYVVMILSLISYIILREILFILQVSTQGFERIEKLQVCRWFLCELGIFGSRN